MLVKNWMTNNVITVTADSSMMKISRLMKENKIRRLPVVDEDGLLIGMVSDRDVKDASPSKATTLEIHELYYLLSELKVKDIMTKRPVSAKATDSVEAVAALLMHNSFGGVPVVDNDGKVCGIITDTDIFKVLVSITGVESGGIQMVFDLPDKQELLLGILDDLRVQNVAVLSVFSAPKSLASSARQVFIRLQPMEIKKQHDVIAAIQKKYPLVYCENGVALGKI